MERKEVINFVNGNVYNMMEYREYLNSRAKKVLNDYERHFAELELSDKITHSQKDELEIYHGMIDDIANRKNEKDRNENKVLTLTRKKDKLSMSGFINIILVILLIVISGITVGGMLFTYLM